MAITSAGTPSKAAGGNNYHKKFYQKQNTLAQGACQLNSRFAVYDMRIPEKIELMSTRCTNVACKIEYNKGNQVYQPGGFDMRNCDILQQPGISDDGNIQSQYAHPR